jgi:hypothetical protein
LPCLAQLSTEHTSPYQGTSCKQTHLIALRAQAAYTAQLRDWVADFRDELQDALARARHAERMLLQEQVRGGWLPSLAHCNQVPHKGGNKGGDQDGQWAWFKCAVAQQRSPLQLVQCPGHCPCHCPRAPAPRISHGC